MISVLHGIFAKQNMIVALVADKQNWYIDIGSISLSGLIYSQGVLESSS